MTFSKLQPERHFYHLRRSEMGAALSYNCWLLCYLPFDESLLVLPLSIWVDSKNWILCQICIYGVYVFCSVLSAGAFYSFSIHHSLSIYIFFFSFEPENIDRLSCYCTYWIEQIHFIQRTSSKDRCFDILYKCIYTETNENEFGHSPKSQIFHQLEKIQIDHILFHPWFHPSLPGLSVCNLAYSIGNRSVKTPLLFMDTRNSFAPLSPQLVRSSSHAADMACCWR